MRATMVVVACEGPLCAEATKLDVLDGLDAQLAAAGWTIAPDGAELCPDCSERESRRADVTLLGVRRQRAPVRPILANR